MVRSAICFSVRDVLWLTLVVGLGLGWLINRHQLVEQAQTWRGRAGALEHMFGDIGWEIRWDFKSSRVAAIAGEPRVNPYPSRMYNSTGSYEPRGDNPYFAD